MKSKSIRQDEHMTDRQCPHCGIAPANPDGFACDYCRGWAHRPPNSGVEVMTAVPAVTRDGYANTRLIREEDEATAHA